MDHTDHSMAKHQPQEQSRVNEIQVTDDRDVEDKILDDEDLSEFLEDHEPSHCNLIDTPLIDG